MEGAFLFYDITNERSFDNMLKWLKDIYECEMKIWQYIL